MLDWTYLFVIIGSILSVIASAGVNRAFKKYSTVLSVGNYRAEECAARILSGAGISDVGITRISGDLTDNYNPTNKTLSLSSSVYGQSSIAAIGVAAHECGHAVQHHTGYIPLKLRSASVPITNIGSRLSWPAILLGLALGIPVIADIGVYLFMLVVFFQLITLPVEINASRRALNILRSEGILREDELKGAKSVLTAAAMTYIAAFASSALQLLRLILITRRNDK